MQGGGGVAATILEVSFATTFGTDETDKSERTVKVEQLKAAVKAAHTEVSAVRAATQRLEQQDKFLAGFVDTALGVGKTGESKVESITDLTKVQEVFDFFENKATTLDQNKRELQAKREAAELVARAAEQELAKYQSSINSNKRSNDVTVQLMTTQEANGKPIILRISYMVGLISSFSQCLCTMSKLCLRVLCVVCALKAA